MKKISLITLFLFLFNFLSSQNDNRANSLLEEVSKKIDSAASYSIDFTYSLENISEDIKQESNGKIIIEKDNYFLEFMGIIQISDSNKIYSIVPENEEVIISDINENDDSGTIKPSKLLNFYREGYLILWDKSENYDSTKIQFVKLIPSNSDTDIDYLLLGIDIETKNIQKLVEIGKNKTKTILTVDSIEYNPEIDKDLFIFNENDYPDYYIESL